MYDARIVYPSRIGSSLLGSRQELSLCLNRIRMARARRAKPEQPEGDQKPARDLGPMFHHCLDLVRQPGGVRDTEVQQETSTEHVQQEGEGQQQKADADQTVHDGRAP